MIYRAVVRSRAFGYSVRACYIDIDIWASKTGFPER